MDETAAGTLVRASVQVTPRLSVDEEPRRGRSATTERVTDAPRETSAGVRSYPSIELLKRWFTRAVRLLRYASRRAGRRVARRMRPGARVERSVRRGA